MFIDINFNMVKLVILLILFSPMEIVCAEVVSNKLIFVSTLPKAGSHLIVKCLELITKKKPMFIGGPTLDKAAPFVPYSLQHIPWGHFFYSNEIKNYLDTNGFKKFFIYRDPRDLLISTVHWYSTQQVNIFPSSLKFSQKIDLLLDSGLFKSYEHDFIPWLRDPKCCCIKFEDLVGVKGGGLADKQIATIRRISNHIGLRLSMDDIKYVIDNLYGGTYTFREGKIGSWKKHLTFNQIKKLKSTCGRLLIKLEYEKSFNW